MSGLCLDYVWMVSGFCLDYVRTVTGTENMYGEFLDLPEMSPNVFGTCLDGLLTSGQCLNDAQMVSATCLDHV